VVSIYLLLFSSPNLSGRRLDVYHTSTHGVALVRIYNAGLKHAARSSLKIQDAKRRQKSPSGHHRTTLLGYIFATKKHRQSEKNVKQQYLLHMSPQSGELRPTIPAEIGPVVWGTLANFNGFRVLAALLHDTVVGLVGVSQTLRR